MRASHRELNLVCNGADCGPADSLIQDIELFGRIRGQRVAAGGGTCREISASIGRAGGGRLSGQAILVAWVALGGTTRHLMGILLFGHGRAGCGIV